MVRKISLLMVASLILGLCASVAAQQEEIEEVEEVETVEVVQVLETAPAAVHEDEGLSIVQIYGRLHPAFVHLPIGFLVLLLVFDLIGFIKKGAGLEKAGMIALGATVFACLPSLLSGFLRASEMWSEASLAPPELGMHRNLMFAMTGAALLAFVVRLKAKNDLRGVLKIAYIVLLLAALGAAAAGAHEGGEMVFGEDHLPF